MRESSDIRLRGIGVGVGIILAGIAASLFLAWLIASHSAAPLSGASSGRPPDMPRPVLQTVPHQDLQAFLREKRARLESSGWVDEKAGRMHIPIERAMRLLAERGRQP